MARKSKKKTKARKTTGNAAQDEQTASEAENVAERGDDASIVVGSADHAENQSRQINSQVDHRPASVTYMWINALAFAITVAVWFVLQDNEELARRHLALICIAVYGLFVVILENVIYKVYSRSSTGHNYSKGFTPNLGRVLVKTLGFYVTIALVAGCFYLFEIYRRPFFDEVWLLTSELMFLWPGLMIFQFAYFYFSDGYQTKPKDNYWMLGMACVGVRKHIDRQILGQHFLGWLVKAFFLPIMLTYLIGNMFNLNFYWIEQGFMQFYDFATVTMFTVDLLITCAGYMLTFKVLDSHIRTSEPTMLGWCVALAGYYPFWDTVSSSYLPYQDGMYWGHMSGDSTIYGICILTAVLIYIWATLAFGIRFSNLTHRGVLTNGPYRFCKHPAYVSKNLSWWLISVPFWMHDNATFADTVRHCLMLLGVNIIYFMRARTEERHLSWDPDYVAYAIWMNDHSVFAWLGKIFPALQYRAPKSTVIRDTTVKQYLSA